MDQIQEIRSYLQGIPGKLHGILDNPTTKDHWTKQVGIAGDLPEVAKFAFEYYIDPLYPTGKAPEDAAGMDDRTRLLASYLALNDLAIYLGDTTVEQLGCVNWSKVFRAALEGDYPKGGIKEGYPFQQIDRIEKAIALVRYDMKPLEDAKPENVAAVKAKKPSLPEGFTFVGDRLHWKDKPVNVGVTEHKVLCLFVQSFSKVLTHVEINGGVKETAQGNSARIVKNLRIWLESTHIPYWIETVTGDGYRFVHKTKNRA
jgi:hypothetical protein